MGISILIGGGDQHHRPSVWVELVTVDIDVARAVVLNGWDCTVAERVLTLMLGAFVSGGIRTVVARTCQWVALTIGCQRTMWGCCDLSSRHFNSFRSSYSFIACEYHRIPLIAQH